MALLFEALLLLCDALERRPHHLQCDRESKRPSHRETHQKNCRDHRPHPTARPKSVLSFGSVPAQYDRGQTRRKERANRQIGTIETADCRSLGVLEGSHLNLVAEVLLSLRKQELFMAVALCFPLQVAGVGFYLSGHGLAFAPGKQYLRPDSTQNESGSCAFPVVGPNLCSGPPSKGPRRRPVGFLIECSAQERTRSRKATCQPSPGRPHRFEISDHWQGSAFHVASAS